MNADITAIITAIDNHNAIVELRFCCEMDRDNVTMTVDTRDDGIDLGGMEMSCYEYALDQEIERAVRTETCLLVKLNGTFVGHDEDPYALDMDVESSDMGARCEVAI